MSAKRFRNETRFGRIFNQIDIVAIKIFLIAAL
jgi:hypothetical protein